MVSTWRVIGRHPGMSTTCAVGRATAVTARSLLRVRTDAGSRDGVGPRRLAVTAADLVVGGPVMRARLAGGQSMVAALVDGLDDGHDTPCSTPLGSGSVDRRGRGQHWRL